MKLNLTIDKEEVRKKFISLKDRSDIADLLEVDIKTLIYFLYRKDKPISYKTFSIRKKTGGERIINAPTSSLKILQRKLAYVLSMNYIPKPSVYGFCLNKNIKKNANRHFNKKNVFNIDLDNFFPTIHIGRVIGMFSSKPFSLPREVAITLAQICCYEGKLPQGAPTSPIVSNIICRKLDGQLQSLAKEFRCTYTRYADDITFSTTYKSFPFEIVGEKYEPGLELMGAIKQNGFNINEKKTRLQNKINRQEVTGLIVNEFVNVKRDYINNIRAILHSWEKEGIENASKKYFTLNGKNCLSEKSSAFFKESVLGKINYIRAIKGYRSPVYRKLINKYNINCKNGKINLETDENKMLCESVWVVDNISAITQGTCFLLKDYGLITAYHVVKNQDKIEVYRSDLVGKKYIAVVDKYDEHLDIAILKIEGFDTVKSIDSLDYNLNDNYNYGDEFKIAAYPDHFISNSIYTTKCDIASKIIKSCVEYIVFNEFFTGGMSGGPILNKKNEVVAIITDGSPNKNDVDKTKYNAGIPIRYINELIKNSNEPGI